jgi:hypothetical protein
VRLRGVSSSARSGYPAGKFAGFWNWAVTVTVARSLGLLGSVVDTMQTVSVPTGTVVDPV